MVRLVIEGFKTLEDAMEYASWFEGQGEQDASIWMEMNDKPTYYVKGQQVNDFNESVYIKVE